jgi:hypothetical protein
MEQLKGWWKGPQHSGEAQSMDEKGGARHIGPDWFASAANGAKQRRAASEADESSAALLTNCGVYFNCKTTWRIVARLG